MPENKNSSAFNNVLADLAWSASQARLIEGNGAALAADIDALIAKHTNSAQTTPVALEATTVEAVTVPAAAQADLTDGELGDAAEADEFDVDLEAELGAAIDDVTDEMFAAATPQGITLTVTRVDNEILSGPDAVLAVTMVLGSLVAVVGELTIGEVSLAGRPNTAEVHLVAAEGVNLSRFGAGKDGFNAAFPIGGVGDVTITSEVDQPADADLAAELGMVAEDLPEVPEGQHAINGVLEVIEEMTGQRPVAQGNFAIFYSKDNGDTLTEAEVTTIVNHPITAGPHGLARFGASVMLGIDNGADASVKIARFSLLEIGEINPAVMAVQAGAYRGTFDFGGTIGSVSANAEFTLVEADIDVDA